MTSPRLSSIWIYPIKSLDPLALEQVRITAGGSLQNDRRWALVNAQGQWVNGKREPRIHRLRAKFTLQGDEISTVALWISEPGSGADGSLGYDDRGHDDRVEATFNLHTDRPELEAWLSSYFEQPVLLRENPDQGFPDDLNASGPTIVSEASLATVGQWFPGMTMAETRLRFRANLELSGVPPFWEDQLFGTKGSDRAFRMGSVEFLGVNPCLRCVVPTRHPTSGEVTPNFVVQFSQHRRAQLPPWISDRSHFDNSYRFTVNTRICPTSYGATLSVGNSLTL